MCVNVPVYASPVYSGITVFKQGGAETTTSETVRRSDLCEPENRSSKAHLTVRLPAGRHGPRPVTKLRTLTKTPEIRSPVFLLGTILYKPSHRGLDILLRQFTTT